MSLERLRAIMRTYTPGRRVLIKDDAASERRDKVPQGVTEGLILKVVPLPSESTSDNIVIETFGIEVEIETSPGRFDSLILGLDDVELDPLSIVRIRNDLWRRTVNFPRSSGIGIDFPKGASDFGVVDDAHFRTDEDGRLQDLGVSLRIEVDPAANPEGVNVFYVDADFVQCVLLVRKPSD